MTICRNSGTFGFSFDRVGTAKLSTSVHVTLIRGCKLSESRELPGWTEGNIHWKSI